MDERVATYEGGRGQACRLQLSIIIREGEGAKVTDIPQYVKQTKLQSCSLIRPKRSIDACGKRQL